MVLKVHHMGISQGERILFLCEELGIPYELEVHTRDPLTSPESLKSVPGNKTGKAPFISDTEPHVLLSESGAICQYILDKYGEANPTLALQYGDKDFADYVYWFHFANGTLHPAMSTNMFINMSKAPEDDMVRVLCKQRLDAAIQMLDGRLKDNKWLAGDQFTAADVMTVYCLTTQRYFGPLVNFEPYPNILRYLQDIGKRPAYQRAMQKGDPEMALLLGAEPPEKSLIEAGGVQSDLWRKQSS